MICCILLFYPNPILVSSAVESEDTGYGAQFSYEEKKKDKKKVSMRSKKSKNNQLGSDAVR